MISFEHDLSATHILSFGGPIDSCVSNGVLYSRISISGVTIHVINTHLNSDTSVLLQTRPGTFSHVRASQLLELRALIDTHASDGGAVFVCGDMNIDARSKHMAEEYATMLTLLEVQDVVHSDLPARPTLGDTKVVGDAEVPAEAYFTSSSDQMSKQCVDYILFRPDRSRRVSLGSTEVLGMDVQGRPYARLSDHCGVAASVIISLK
jgi:endonuclease/exonuclease/phosphatase family metal-dependent hydrolase